MSHEDLDDELAMAAMQGDERRAGELLAKGASPSVALHGGTRDPAILRRLIEHGLDVRGNPATRYSPLCTAARGGSAECVRMLLAAGAGTAEFDTSSRATPLMLAAEALELATVTTLLQHGADPNARDDRGNTPLMYAAMLGNPEVLEIVTAIVRAGGDPAVRNAAGECFWDVVEQCRHDVPAMRAVVDRALAR